MQINIDGYGEQKTYARPSFCLKMQRLSLVFGVWCLSQALKGTKQISIRIYTFSQ
jgi:hypothetical protein